EEEEEDMSMEEVLSQLQAELDMTLMELSGMEVDTDVAAAAATAAAATAAATTAASVIPCSSSSSDARTPGGAEPRGGCDAGGEPPLCASEGSHKEAESAAPSGAVAAPYSPAPSPDSASTPDTVVDGNIGSNHTVLATAKGVFGGDGGVLESKVTGVSIFIPKGALPEGSEQEIYFNVCQDNSILPPLDKEKGETLLSPLVMCGPHGLKFNQPVELRLPHCASVNPDSWSFALKSSDSPTGQPTQWQNLTLAGMDGVAHSVAHGKVGKNSVSVLVDHF
ncbi:hypothetical protein Ahia01_000912900, partial [Argonauta hians]